jgi:hypothetical protein
LVFFIIMMVATTFILVLSQFQVHTVESSARENLMQYTDETKQTLMEVTILKTAYTDKNGNLTYVWNQSVQDLLLMEMVLLDDGLNKANLSMIENDIDSTASNFIRYGFDFAISVKYSLPPGHAHSVFISNENGITAISEIKQDHSVISWTIPMIKYDKKGETDISFTLWRTFQ